MMLVGSPNDWHGFIDSQIPSILKMVVETWDSLPAPCCDALEDDVTEAFCVALRRSRDRCELPFSIHIQLVELEPAEGEDQGRMDIVFSPPAPREDIYFCLECKRLNVRSADGSVRPYFSEYIVHGMLRFIRGQYGKIAKHGGMAAYVLNGDIDSAIAGIQSNIIAYEGELLLASSTTLGRSSFLPQDNRLRETVHTRVGHSKILLHHLFLAGDPESSFRSK
ncbi:MAG: hypothetical protein KDA90_21385 [Planctomycetaceae bacterium]|nr:hypothetical protein [Planctomycetaceae bacterium]